VVRFSQREKITKKGSLVKEIAIGGETRGGSSLKKHPVIETGLTKNHENKGEAEDDAKKRRKAR